jgi:hypothetical protein
MQMWNKYLGPWESKGMMAQLDNNMREKRNQLQGRHLLQRMHSRVWAAIFKDITDPTKKAKAEKCKAAVEKHL